MSTIKIRKKGSLMLELLIALFVGTIILSSLNQLVLGNQIIYQDILKNDSWISKVEATSSLAFSDEQSVAKQISDFVWQKIFFDLSVLFTTKTHDWSDDFGKNTCTFGTDPSSDYSKPIVSMFNIVMDPSNTPTQIFSRGRYLYMTTNSSRSTSTDFYIIDKYSNAAKGDWSFNPRLVYALDTGPGLAAIYVVGTIAYVGNTSSTNQLRIIDVSDPTHPQILSSLKMSHLTNGVTTMAQSIFYDNGFVYLGLAKNSGEELRVIDVSSSTFPVEVGGFELGAGVNSIYVQDGYVYVATPNNPELVVLSVNFFGKIVVLKQVGSFDATGSSGNGKSLDFSMGNIYLGRTKGGGKEVYSLSSSSLMQSAVVDDSSSVLKSFVVDSSVDAIAGRGSLIALASASTTGQFEIWKDSVIQSGINFSNSIDHVKYRPASLSCDGNSFFVATATSSYFLYKIDFQKNKLTAKI